MYNEIDDEEIDYRDYRKIDLDTIKGVDKERKLMDIKVLMKDRRYGFGYLDNVFMALHKDEDDVDGIWFQDYAVMGDGSIEMAKAIAEAKAKRSHAEIRRFCKEFSEKWGQVFDECHDMMKELKAYENKYVKVTNKICKLRQKEKVFRNANEEFGIKAKVKQSNDLQIQQLNKLEEPLIVEQLDLLYNHIVPLRRLIRRKFYKGFPESGYYTLVIGRAECGYRQLKKVEQLVKSKKYYSWPMVMHELAKYKRKTLNFGITVWAADFNMRPLNHLM